MHFKCNFSPFRIQTSTQSHSCIIVTCIGFLLHIPAGIIWFMMKLYGVFSQTILFWSCSDLGQTSIRIKTFMDKPLTRIHSTAATVLSIMKQRHQSIFSFVFLFSTLYCPRKSSIRNFGSFLQVMLTARLKDNIDRQLITLIPRKRVKKWLFESGFRHITSWSQVHCLLGHNSFLSNI